MTVKKKTAAARARLRKRHRKNHFYPEGCVDEATPVRTGKVRKVLRSLADGSFIIDSERIAEEMLKKK